MRALSHQSAGLAVLLVLGLTASVLVIVAGALVGQSLQERWRAERLSG